MNEAIELFSFLKHRMKNHIKTVITINNTDSGRILAEFFPLKHK